MQDDYYYAVSSGHKSNEIMEVRSLLTIQLPYISERRRNYVKPIKITGIERW